MTTYTELIHQARHYLMTAQPDRLNVLAAAIDAQPTTTTIQFVHDLEGINKGSILCIDLEEMYVLSVSGQTAGSTATVIRAANGSTISSHIINSVIQVSPQFSDFRIAKYINEALQDVSVEGLFRILSVEFTFNPATAGYNLNAPGFIEAWRVRYKTPGPIKDWPIMRPDQYRIDQAPNLTDFPNGIQIVLYTTAYPGQLVRVSYKSGFTQLSNPADDVLAVTGLHTEAHDILPLGAALYLLHGRPIKRTFLNRQPEPRRQQEVTTTDIQRSPLGLMEKYQERLTNESRRLRKRYPGVL